MRQPKRALSQDWNFLAVEPEIAAEWDYAANHPTRPEEVTPGSSKKRWWICRRDKRHRWPAAPVIRRAGHGCPVCSGRMAGPENSLAAQAPHVIKEWHPDKNGFRTPHNVTYGSKLKIWWKCRRGHEWPATPNNRTAADSGCPKCAKTSTSRIEIRVASELITLIPEAEWRPKVQGHECDVLILSANLAIEVDGFAWHSSKAAQARDKKKAKTLSAAGIRLVRLRDNRLPSLTTDEVPFGIGEDDARIMRRLAQKLGTVCTEEGRTETALLLRDYAHKGSLAGEGLYRDMMEVLPGPPPEKSFQAVVPEIAEEWDAEKNGELRPADFYPYSHYPAHWRCKNCGHNWKVAIGSRTSGNGCPSCSGRVATPENCLRAKHPELLMYWDWEKNIVDPSDLLPGSSFEAHWRCPKEHAWTAPVCAIVRVPGCPECKRAHKSLANRAPDVAATWHPVLNGALTPDDVSYGSKEIAWWQCEVNPEHFWDAGINTRTSGRGCPYCSGKRVCNSNCLATLRPDLATQWDQAANGDLTPRDVTLHSSKSVFWRCPPQPPVAGNGWQPRSRQWLSGLPGSAGWHRSSQFAGFLVRGKRPRGEILFHR